MTRTLLVLDPSALFADTQLDYTALDRWEHAVVEAAAGWSPEAPMYRRALSDWRERLDTLCTTLDPDVIAVVAMREYAARITALRLFVALSPDADDESEIPVQVDDDEASIAVQSGPVTSQLPVQADSADEVAFALGRVDSEFERIVIVTGQREADYVERLISEVAWRTSTIPVLVNTGRLGLLERDIAILETTLRSREPTE
jgi:hypothetical protein